MNQLRQFFADSDGELAIVQPPNLPILAFVGFKLLALISDGQIEHAAQVAADISLLVWAGLEFFMGESWFRRLLGVVAVMWLALTRLM